jgi:diaminopimelate epimerase
VPHLVVEVSNADGVDVAGVGAILRRAPALGHEGANVNFVEVRGPDRLRVRTFERGVEGETLACGTGAVAVAAWHAAGGAPWERHVEPRGRDVLVVRGDGETTWLEGPARESYEGNIDLGVIVRR